ncbi:anthranilate synthase component II [Trichococcus collinsii]|uniref:Para-aminobenzoate synthetase component 2 n=1 Tax=Trichococcus collinsii TaxID=157076 RepID=A0AB38A0P5_9LACT|nr:aminodeoxychorismate/anthranilate synthase component II [Trichococcus collinsii]CZR06486.1 anthranilate synthase component ii signature [Trichococcus collinsii]SEA32220.1 para-aminobenzoate synthetase component 2 [Trichococcus collinsii]
MILVIDNYDSFTYNLVQYLRQLDENVVVKRNDEITIEQIAALDPLMILISPGPKTPNEAGISLDVVKHFSGTVPILGICLGHQTIAGLFGAAIVKAKEPVHGKVHAIHHTGKGVFQGLKSPLNVTRYHSLIVEKGSLPEALEVTAWTEAGEIMGFIHREELIEGVQFHPEAILTEHGLDMLRNFYERAKKKQEGAIFDGKKQD